MLQICLSLSSSSIAFSHFIAIAHIVAIALRTRRKKEGKFQGAYKQRENNTRQPHDQYTSGTRAIAIAAMKPW
jgi:hypothetical protein